MIFYTSDKVIIDFRGSLESIINQYENLYKDHCPDWQKKIFEVIIDFKSNESFEIKTSGTTSASKTILAKKEHLLASATKTNNFFKLQTGNSSLLCMNPSFIGGKMMIIRAIERQLKLVCIQAKSSSIEHLEEGIDFTAMVPMQVDYILKHAPDQLKLCKKIIIGGGTIKQQAIDKLCQLGVNTYSTFGMTETYSHIALQELSPNKSSLYELVDGVSISSNQNQCLQISAPHLGIDFLETKDIVEIFSQGFMWRGRFDDMINSGGVKIFPEEIERKAQTLIKNEFIISSLPDEKLGEKVILIIEGYQEETNQDLQQALKNVLPKYHDPKSIFYLPEFPRTLTNKIKRKDVRQLLIDGLTS